MSGLFATANPHRIKAAHRRRRQVASGQSVQRYYDPGIGRFLSVDPVTANSSTGANFNRYKYASNIPYRFIDPDGRRDWDSLRAHSSNLASLANTAALAKEFGADRIEASNVSSPETRETRSTTLQNDANKVVGMVNDLGDRDLVDALNSVESLAINDVDGPRQTASDSPAHAVASYTDRTINFFNGYFSHTKRIEVFIHEVYHLTPAMEAVRQQDPECGWSCNRPGGYEQKTRKSASDFMDRWWEFRNGGT